MILKYTHWGYTENKNIIRLTVKWQWCNNLQLRFQNEKKERVEKIQNSKKIGFEQEKYAVLNWI